MTNTIDKIKFLCDKFGWELSEGGTVHNAQPVWMLPGRIKDVGGLELFAMHAMCEAYTHRVKATLSIAQHAVTVPCARNMSDRVFYFQDETPLGLATAIIDALYVAMGGEE